MTTREVTYTYGDGRTEVKTRIYADEGKAVTADGQNFYGSIDVDSTEGWYEVDDPDPVPEELIAEELLSILLGGETSNNE